MHRNSITFNYNSITVNCKVICHLVYWFAVFFRKLCHEPDTQQVKYYCKILFFILAILIMKHFDVQYSMWWNSFLVMIIFSLPILANCNTTPVTCQEGCLSTTLCFHLFLKHNFTHTYMWMYKDIADESGSPMCLLWDMTCTATL